MRNLLLRPFGLVALACLTMASHAAVDSADFNARQGPLEILRVTPAGDDVPAGRQIVVQFNRPVVPVGRMARDDDEVPITIEPTLDCRWRWLNTSALACQLDERGALRVATRYRLVVNPGIEAEDGATTEAPFVHSFTTERPKVRYVRFKTWRAPGLPVMRLLLNLDVDADSVEKHVTLEVTATRRSVPVKASVDQEGRALPRRLPMPGEKGALVTREGARQQVDDAAAKAQRLWLIEPVEELPLDAAVTVRVRPGLTTPRGPELGIQDKHVLEFHTFPEFRFLGVRCRDIDSERIEIAAQAHPDASPRCNPLENVALAFSTPVVAEALRDHLTITPDLAGGRTDYDPWANYHGYSRLNRPHRKDREYVIWLPEVLKAWESYRLESGEGLRDEFGRTLVEPVAFDLNTDHRAPEYRLTHPVAVIEKDAATEVPVVVTNLDELTLRYRRLTPDAHARDQRARIDLPLEEDVAYARPLGVRELLDDRSGAVFASVASSPRVRAGHEGPTAFFAQVTPFSVHAKVGHYNTTVWVTDLATGKPVEGAQVRIHLDRYKALSPNPDILASTTTDADGTAVLPGSETLDPDAQLIGIGTWRWSTQMLVVRVDKNEDMALLPLDSRFQARGQIWARKRPRYGHIRAWGLTAQGVYKAGDTIQYKLYVRNESNDTLTPAPQGRYTLAIIDPQGKEVHKVEAIELSEFGAWHGEFTVPASGAVGWYRFQLKSDFMRHSLEPMRVLVSDFTPSPFKVSADINGERFEPGDALRIDTQASMHAGGPFADAPARTTVTLRAAPFRPQTPTTRNFVFDSGFHRNAARQTLHQSEARVDEKGQLVSELRLADGTVLYGRLRIESAVRDDRGKYVAGFASAEYLGRDRFVGLRQRQWVLKEDEAAEVESLVVDATGAPRAGTAVETLIEREETKAARVKGAGNAYLTRYTHTWIKVHACRQTSGSEPLTCRFTPSAPGSYRITATIDDTGGRRQVTQIRRWVAGKGRVVWSETPGHALEVVPEKTTYKVGETARYLIKNPFPGALALVSVERYGVIEHWTQVLDTGTPIVELPVKPDYLPGFYLSVLIASPRVDQPMEHGRVDLGKPAFRMGYVQTNVRDPYKEIVVSAYAERERYRPRETVRVELSAAPRQGADLQPVEFAVAVLDESVFALLAQGRDYYDPYKGFYSLENLEVSNFNLILRLVGRQKFEKKGANAGGGGGGDFQVRSLIKYLAYWNPSLEADAEGRANFEFEAPDNLTGWRVLAMAVTPGERVGLGDTGFKVNRPTEVRPLMPNQVTEGDRFRAGFSVFNRTDQARELNIRLDVAGPVVSNEGAEPLVATRSLALAPWQRSSVWLPIETRDDGVLRFTARAWDGLDRDGIVHDVPVRQRQAPETAATYGTTAQARVEESVAFPQDILANVGGLSVVASPSVIGNLEGAFEYLRDYPYICWEQKLTQGTMASHYGNLQSWLAEDLEWPGSEDLPRRILDRAASYQAPNGGMCYFVPRNDRVSPYLSAYTALAFNWLRRSGEDVPEAVEARLHAYLETLLRKDVLPSFFSRGMASTVRAVALAALADHGKVDGSDIERYRPHVKDMSLFGKAHYLMAALRVAGTEDLRRAIAEEILAHAGQSGGKFVFNEAIDDGYARILASPLRANCAVLSALTAMGETDQGAPLVGDVPGKLARTITQSRGNRDHWENTQENMFCMNAITEFARVYESVKPSMTLTARLDGDPIGEGRFEDFRDPPMTFHRPMQPTDPGRSGTLTLEKTGDGRVYYALQMRYSPSEPRTEPINAGLTIHREYSVKRNGEWTLLKDPMRIARGELVRVDLFVSLPAARNFVVVDDPVPGGLEPVNRDLATASQVDAEEGDFEAAGGSWWFRYSDWSSYGVSRWSFYHQELRHDAVRFYSDYLPAGNYHLSYTAQAIASGEFRVMPSHAEEMYDPDVFAKGVPASLFVDEAAATAQ
jgi:uncharacterized protein YfaS (alpha-2-macroglobulin family)